MTKRRPSRATHHRINEARQRLKDLGPVIPAMDTTVDVTGRPLLSDGQVYVTRAGTRFHDAWCITIADAFDRDPASVTVTSIEDTSRRTRCGNCDTPLTG